MNEWAVIAKNIKHLKAKKHWSQEDLAEAAECSKSVVRDLEAKRAPASVEMLSRIAHALDVSVADLFQEERRVAKPPPASSVIKMFLSIPDEVYEKARHFPPDHLVWKEVMISLEGALADMEGDGGDGEGIAGHGA